MKKYIKPEIKCAAFQAEKGYAMSQGMKNSFGRFDEYDFDRDELNLKKGSRFGGYFEGDNSDWD